jgi:hypothetical protein
MPLADWPVAKAVPRLAKKCWLLSPQPRKTGVPAECAGTRVAFPPPLVIRRGGTGEERRAFRLRRQIPLFGNWLSGPSDSSARRRSARSSFRIDSRRHSKTVCFAVLLVFAATKFAFHLYVGAFLQGCREIGQLSERNATAPFGAGFPRAFRVLSRALRGHRESGEG